MPLYRLHLGLQGARSGKTLVLFTLLLPVLLGMIGLVVDGGLMMAAHRQAQNAADAAATAAVYEKLRGATDDAAKAVAETYAKTYNRLSDATLIVNFPPKKGPHKDNDKYVEVYVTSPVSTWLIHFLDVSQSQTVQARAVAGYEPIGSGQGVIALDKDASPGLNVRGKGTLEINGGIIVNSDDPKNAAITTGENAYVKALSMNVAGEVDGNFDVSVLIENTGLFTPDPLGDLAYPTTANGVVNTDYGSIGISGDTHTLSPGVYDSIRISGSNSEVTFNPGVYVVRGDFSISSAQKVTGEGVMFFITGHNYDATTGLLGKNPKFGKVNLTGGTGLLSPYTSSPYEGMLFFQHRENTNSFGIEGNGTLLFTGTLYAPTARFDISGQGIYDAQFIAGSLDITGNGDLTINYSGNGAAKANVVVLVE